MLSREFAGGAIPRPFKRWAATVATTGLVASMLGGAVVAATPAQASPAKSGAKAFTAVADRPDRVSAVLAAKRQHSRVEVMDERTDASQTFANPDGTFTYQVSAQPRWVRRDGSWVTLDPTLKRTSSGGIAPAATESSLVLSGGGTGPLARMTVDGKAFSLDWPTALPKPTLSGSTATYADVLPSGVDLEVTATAAGGVEETLVVKNATAAADPALARLEQTTATASGGTVTADAGGNLAVKDAKGRTLVTSPAPVMWDSATGATASTASAGSPSSAGSASAAASAPASAPATQRIAGSPATAANPGTRSHTARVHVGLSGHKLQLTPDQDLLRSPDTVFPVYVDPAFVPHPASGSRLHYDEVQQAYPTTSNYDGSVGSGLAVGYQGFSSPTGIERTYYNLSVPSSIAGAVVISATLNTTVTYAAASGSNSTTVNVFSTCTISSSTTWNSQPCKDTSANPNYPNPNTSKAFTTTSTSPNLAVGFDVTSGMQILATKKATNWTVGLFNATETNDIDLVRFSANPTFSITYNNPPATPTNLSMTPTNVVGSSTYTSTGTPTLSASATDANSDTVRLDYQILSGSTVKASGSTAFVNSGATATWKPSTALADGAYTWQVRAYDGHDYSAWSAARAFTVDTAAPPAPTISCSGYPSGQWTAAIPGGTTCTLSDSSSDVVGYSWGLDTDSNTNWTTGNSITIAPGSGWHTLNAFAENKAAKAGAVTYYSFGVGSGGISSPADQSSTSTTLPLQATGPSGQTQVTFKYRVGTSGSFSDIPTAAVTDNGSAVGAWPVSTAAGSNEVTSPLLTWDLSRTVSTDGLLQVQAVFNDASGTTATTPPVNVTLNRSGTGTDFGTTQAGPVTVGLQSGGATVSAQDVSIASYGAGLGVSRTFNSLKTTADSGFGPGWTSGLPAVGSSLASWVSVTDEGSYALLTGKDGSTETFVAGTASNGVTPYTGQGPAAVGGLTLSKSSAGFTLTDTSGTQAVFSVPAGGTSGLYLPSSVTQAGSTRSTGYIYDPTTTSSTYGKLLLVVAPNAAVSTPTTSACPYPANSSSWSKGCRGLQLSYDPATGNISEVDFLSSDGVTLTRTPVAQYSYDATGRLSAEWDPRISPALKTTYSYDETSGDPDFGRLTRISPAQSTAGSLAPWNLAYNDTASSPDYGKLASVSRTHDSADGGGTAKTVVAYSVPLTAAAGGPVDLDAGTAATWGQSDVPVSAVAVFPPDHAPGSNPPSDWTYAQIHYYDAGGREVNTASYNGGWNVTTTEYDSYGNTVRELTAANRATSLAAGGASAATSRQLDTELQYSADGTELTDSYGPTHQAMASGALQTVRVHTHKAYDEGAPNGDKDANGNPYDLVTTETVSASLGATVPGAGEADTRTVQYLYNSGTDNEGWTLHTPLQTVTDPGTGHLALTQTAVFNEDANLYGGEPLQTEARQPGNTQGGAAGTTRTVYYAAGANSVDSACGNQPSWADLVCKTKPAAQPGTSGLAGLPTTTYTYNAYLQPATRTQSWTAADGSTATRTTTSSYDAAGRLVKTAVSTTGTGTGTAVAPSATVYDPATGLPSHTQKLDGSGNVTADLYTTYDDWGQTGSYTDATGQVTYFSHDLTGRVTSQSDSGDTTTFTYGDATDHDGSLTGETDAKAGAFTAGYDPDGNLTTLSYPGGTTASYSYNSNGTATALSYSNSAWSAPISDSVTVNAHGDWTARTVLTGSQVLGYDAADRLTSVADTQAGQCTTRSYGYDADSNRTSLTTAAPAADGSCQSANTATETHGYDAADRLTDPGYAYDTLGDVTTTPSVDAGGAGDLTADYFANGMVADQTQGGRTMSWTLDASADRFASWTDSSTGLTTTNHYAGSSDSPDLVTVSNGAWTRNVSVLGSLAAQATAGGVTLQLADLQGSVMATVDASTGSVLSTTGYTEFGTPETGTNGGYGWLGADQRSGADLGGQILMGARSYNPFTGRFDSVDPVTGGSANAYDYVDQNPVTNVDLSGQWCWWSCHRSHNYNGHHWHWWGLELDLSVHRANNLLWALGASAGITTIAAAVAGIIPGGQLASGLLWILDGVEGFYASWIGYELYNHPNHGVTINISWSWYVWIGHE